jgi:hypothetical protein
MANLEPLVFLVFQPNQEELETAVESLRRKIDESRRLARAEQSANASTIHTPSQSSPTSRATSPSQVSTL